MSNRKHKAKTPSIEIGFFATLGACLQGPGRGAPSVGRHRRPRLLLAIFAALTVAAPLLVFAASTPAITPAFEETLAHAPQISLGCEGATYTSISCAGNIRPEELETHWIVEYATVPGGPWTPVPGGSGTITKAEAEAHPSNLFEVEPTVTSETKYYFRALATNEKGKEEQKAQSEPEPLRPTPEVSNVFNAAATSARVVGFVHPHGFETHWRYEYATSKEGPWTSGAEGAVSQAEVEASEAANEGAPRIEAALTGLAPGSPYYVRLFAEDEPKPGVHKEATSADLSFETAGPPAATTFPTYALHGEAVRLLGAVGAHAGPIDELQTVVVGGGATGGLFELCLESQCTTATATAQLTAGSDQATSIALPVVKGTGEVLGPEAPGSRSEIRGVVASAGRFLLGHPISGPGIAPGSVIAQINGNNLLLSKETTAAVSGAELTSDGQVFVEGEGVSGSGVSADTTITHIEYPSNFTATLTLSADASAGGSVAFTSGLPFGASPKTVEDALGAFSVAGGSAEGEGFDARRAADGSYTVEFIGTLAGRSFPQMTAVASGLTPSGTVTVTTLEDGSRPVVHYHFEYEAQGAGSEPFAHASSTPEEEAGEESVTSSAGEVVGVNLPVLLPGETYRFRLTATNTTAGNPVVHGVQQSFTAPVPPQSASEAPCPNARFRTGPSANLPDCRAYEQLTPREKQGAIEPFRQEVQASQQGADVGEDGDHLMLSEQFTHWGSGNDAGQSPYFFSRGSEGVWQTTAATLQPEAGVDHYVPELESPDLNSFAFSAGWSTDPKSESPDLEFRVGSPGGPYVTVASVPRAEAMEPESQSTSDKLGWLAASEDFSKLILAVTDRSLIPHHVTPTVGGADLYEYSAGVLRQANVTGVSPGATIGTCGAVIVKGEAEENGGAETEHAMKSGAHAVSAEGSRVFFEAVPGSDCSEPRHLYMRVNGTETRDLGAVTFLAANKEGSEVLVDKQSGETREFLLYTTTTGPATTKLLFTLHEQTNEVADLRISEDFNVIYFNSGQHLTPEAPPTTSNGSSTYLYRYDIAAGTLRFVMETDMNAGQSQISPDGRYLYGAGVVAGVPAGGVPASKEEGNGQAFLYDSARNTVECVSCASPFNPEPRWPAIVPTRDSENGHRNTPDGTPRVTMFSADGDYAFFDTIAALVPTDVNGEHEFKKEDGEERAHDAYSDSSDVYEWRRAGVGGCAAVQGCVSLISSGHEGHLVLLLGTTESGGDVFFTSRSQLGPNDDDNSLDIYDARVGGGEPLLAPRPVECEGDACSTPVALPSDLTPASAIFQGAGDLVATLPAVKPRPGPKPGKKTKKKKRRRAKPKKKGKKAGKRASKSNDRRGR